MEMKTLFLPFLMIFFLFPLVYSRDLPAISIQELGKYSGYYSLAHSKSAKMFYFFFQSRNNSTDPVVIWLQGGPGCSSNGGLFYENGPFKISDDLSLIWNDFGWDKVSNIIFVDQPVGTGFSYTSGDLRHDEAGVSNDLYDFLQAFFKDHPNLVKNDLYITGESYAGHYIPALASRVQDGNKRNEGIRINLKGLAIGNGITNPEIQYGAYGDYALQMKLISESDHESLKQTYAICQSATRKCNIDGGLACPDAFSKCEHIPKHIFSLNHEINYYDLRKKCLAPPPSCYDFSKMERLLNQDTVQRVIGVGHIHFERCNETVEDALIGDRMVNLEVKIPALLEDGIKLLVYAGEYDLICNWLGISRWVDQMIWSGQKDFGSAKTVPFLVDGKEAGVMKNYGPLTFLKVHDAGHKVPMDQPKASLQMLQTWMQGMLS